MSRSASRATYDVRGRMWLYPGKAGWHFVNLSRKHSGEIRDLFGGEARGFGSLRVAVTVGRTEWRTSIFPDSRSKTYMFAIKADVRRRERIADGSKIRATVQVL